MFANSYSPIGFYDSGHHHKPPHHLRLSPGGGGDGAGGGASSSYEERKRREDAHRRRRIEAERSRRRRQGDGGLASSHSSPSLLGADYEQPQHQQPKLRFEEEDDAAAAAASRRRQREMMLPSWPQLDDDMGNDELHNLPTRRKSEVERSAFEEEEQVKDDMSLSFSDFAPSFIYASISMSQDEMHVDNNNTIVTKNNHRAPPRKAGSMDSFFSPHLKLDGKLNQMNTNRRNVEEERGVGPRMDMNVHDNEDEDDAASCPPHIIAEEEEEEDEDASDDEIGADYLISVWRSTTGWHRQTVSFQS